MADPRTVILVPRRDGFADRDALWAWCRTWWARELPGIPIVEGHHETGLFNRSAAVNTAAATAGAWEVALVIDADVICDPASVRSAVGLGHETGRLVVPFEVRHNLDRRGSERVMAGERGSWKRWIARSFTDQHSSVIAVPRRLWDAVGGFDEGFAGWGQEDTAFAIACETFAGDKLLHLPGEVWHLWHAAAPEGKRGSPSAVLNRARIARYRAAWGDRDAIAALVTEGRTMSAVRSDGRIPRIIHRTVPADTPAQAEEWWRRLGELHPGWRLLTHRDPLDPAEWPLTAPSWPRAKAGAQLADMVRLEALLRFGGFYLDADMEPFRSLEPLTASPLVAAWEDERCIPNAFLGAVPDHPAIRRCLELTIARLPGGDIWAAGPGVTTEVLAAEPEALLLPPGSVYPVHYRDPERDRLMAEHRPAPWTFALHHYWGSWLPEGHRRVPAS